MTEQTQPTDAELMPCPFCGTQPDECDIGQFVVECPSCAIVGPASDNSNAARRAWNTRWSTPAGAGEVADRADAVNLARNALGPYDCAITKKGVRVLAEAVLSMDAALTTPQPINSGSLPEMKEINDLQPTQAQAGAVPLTVDEVEQLIAQWSYELHGDRARYLVRMTEQHHGIKGGQHGTDT